MPLSLHDVRAVCEEESSALTVHDEHASFPADAEVRDVVIDTRAIAPGSVFVALQGASHHGVEFAQEAAERGALALVTGGDAADNDIAAAARHLPVIEVLDSDGVDVLGRIARTWRRSLGCSVVGVTGSVGKTSCKDMLAALCARSVPTIGSHRNYNNEIGVPLTLLSADASTATVVCEMGMRGLGQITQLCEIAEPNIGIVLNARDAHIELLGSQQNIVRAKAELLAWLDEQGTAIVPINQPELVTAHGAMRARVRTFGSAGSGADCEIATVDRHLDGIAGTLVLDGRPLAFKIEVHGIHQALNLAAAVLAVDALGLDVPSAIEFDRAELRIADGRGHRMRCTNGGLLIDDAYNASPASMRAALTELDACAADHSTVAVLGEMAELGEHGPALHAEVGAYAAGVMLDTLVVIGSTANTDALVEAYAAASGEARVLRYDSVVAAVNDWEHWRGEGAAILVKASRAIGLHTLVEAIAAEIAEVRA